MKKLFAIVAACLLLFSLTACGQSHKGEASGYTMSDELAFLLVKVPLPATKVIFQLHNPTDIPYYFGWDYEFEVLDDGVWYTTDYTGNHDIPAELLVLEPGSTIEHTFYTDGGIEFRPGTYRVVMEFWEETGQGALEKGIFICGAFTVEY